MGLEIDMKIVWSVLKKPIGPAIGFASQFIFMPLCAYGLAKAFLLNGMYINTIKFLFCRPVNMEESYHD